MKTLLNAINKNIRRQGNEPGVLTIIRSSKKPNTFLIKRFSAEDDELISSEIVEDPAITADDSTIGIVEDIASYSDVDIAEEGGIMMSSTDEGDIIDVSLNDADLDDVIKDREAEGFVEEESLELNENS